MIADCTTVPTTEGVISLQYVDPGPTIYKTDFPMAFPHTYRYRVVSAKNYYYDESGSTEICNCEDFRDVTACWAYAIYKQRANRSNGFYVHAFALGY